MPDLFWLSSSPLPLPLTLCGVAVLLLFSNRDKQIKVAPRARRAVPSDAPASPVANRHSSEAGQEHAPKLQMPPIAPSTRTGWRSISFTIQGDRRAKR